MDSIITGYTTYGSAWKAKAFLLNNSPASRMSGRSLSSEIAAADCRTIHGLPLPEDSYPTECPIRRRVCRRTHPPHLSHLISQWRSQVEPQHSEELCQQLTRERGLMVEYCHFTCFPTDLDHSEIIENTKVPRFESVEEYDRAILRGLESMIISNKRDWFFFAARIVAMLVSIKELEQQLLNPSYKDCWQSEDLLYIATHGGREAAVVVLEHFAETMDKAHLALIARHYPSLMDGLLDRGLFSQRDDVPHLLTAALDNPEACQRIMKGGRVNPYISLSHRCFLAQDDEELAWQLYQIAFQEYFHHLNYHDEYAKDLICAFKWLALHPGIAAKISQNYLAFSLDHKWEMLTHVYKHHLPLVTQEGLRGIASQPGRLSELLLCTGPELLPLLEKYNIEVPLPEETDHSVHSRHPLLFDAICTKTQFPRIWRLMQHSSQASRRLFQRLDANAADFSSSDRDIPKGMMHPSNQGLIDFSQLPLCGSVPFPFDLLQNHPEGLIAAYMECWKKRTFLHSQHFPLPLSGKTPASRAVVSTAGGRFQAHGIQGLEESLQNRIKR